MERRKALQRILLGTGTVFLVPSALVSCTEDPGTNWNPGGGNGNNQEIEIDLDDNNNSILNSEGGFLIVSGIIVVNTGGNFIALSSVCTHQGCAVTYDKSNNIFPCPCHGSIFSPTGSVLQGPANAPLKNYPVERSGNILTILKG